MLKKLKIALGIIALGALCGGLAACNDGGAELDKYDAVVYYDANGGSYENREGVSVADGFKFANYEADEDGNYKIKLTSPESASRGNKVTLTKEKNFFAGWYRTREVVVTDGVIKDASGRKIVEDAEEGKYYVVDSSDKPLDVNGNVLTKRDGAFYIEGTDKKSAPVISEPVYTYDGYWNFDSDRFECSESGERELTLYAGWVPYYSFEYYVKTDGSWVKYGTTDFDYKTTNAEGSTTADHDTVWVPEWKDGVMDHKHKYSNKDDFKFPAIEGKTFVAAYTDEACTQKIEGMLEHHGTLDLQHARPIDSVHKIYVEFENVTRYRIETAKQFVDNADLSGYYTILSDLDFTGLNWPNRFTVGAFKGEIVSEGDNVYTLSNINSIFNSGSAKYGGLFGKVDAGAKIERLKFADMSFKVEETYIRQVCSFGAFAGEIDGAATVSSVTIDGKLILGKMNNLAECTVHMLAGSGDVSGVSVGAAGLRLQACGEELVGRYAFTVDVENTKLDADGSVKVAFANTQKEEEIYDINTFGGN